MSIILENFLAQFESTISKEIVEFGKRLAKIDADVNILMARKAACFVECLETLHLTKLSGDVASDRILDMDSSWLRGKRVALIDDALISGTTLYQTKEKLEKAHANVSIHVFCTNKDWYVRDLVIPEQPYLELSNTQTVTFCSNVVDAISIIPRPYGVDYPLYLNLRIPVRSLESIITTANWESYNVTSPLQRTTGVFSTTFIPNEQIKSQFNKSLGRDFSEYAQLLKIRLYGRLTESKREIYWCKVLPIVVLNPLSNEQINHLWDSIVLSYEEFPKSTFETLFTSSSSKLRFIQYITATRLGKLWIRDVSEIISSNVIFQEDSQNIRFSFPPQVANYILQISNEEKPIFANVPNLIPATKDSTNFSTKNNNQKDMWGIQDLLIRPFNDFYFNKELEARKLSLEYGHAVFQKPEYFDILNRLNTGLSFLDLQAILSNLTEVFDVPKVVSLFIDVAIDQGFIVPITAKQGEYLSRAYRHGEEIPFTESEATLCWVMLERFSQAVERSDLPHLWVEKLLVLMIRIGVHQNLFSPWKYILSDRQTVGIRYSLKGAVLQTDSLKLYSYNPQGALTKRFIDAGYLKQDKKNGLYQLGEKPLGAIKDDALHTIRLIGSMFGLLLKKNAQGKPSLLTTKELILIATCVSPNDTAAALAVSIDMFARKWIWIEKRFVSSSSPIACANLLGSLNSEALFEAISSAIWKFEAHITGEPQKIIKRIADALPDDPVQLYKDIWGSFWSKLSIQENNPELKSLLGQEGTWCIEVGLFFKILEFSLRYIVEMNNVQNRKEKSGLFSKRTQENLREISNLCDTLGIYNTRGAKKLKKEIESMLPNSKEGYVGINKLREYALEKLNRLSMETPRILAQVDTIVNTFGHPQRATEYSHYLYIDYAEIKIAEDDFWNKVRTILSKYKNIADKKNSDQRTQLADIPFEYGGFTKGKWICSYGVMSRKWLVSLACEIFSELSHVVSLRITLLLHLPPNERLWRSNGSSIYIGNSFWGRAHEIINTVSAEGGRSLLILSIPSNQSNVHAAEEEILQSNTATLNINMVSTKETTLSNPVRQAFVFKYFTFNENLRREGPKLKTRLADIGIITVVNEEVRAVTNSLLNAKKVSSSKTRRMFYEGTLPGTGNTEYRVACTQQLAQGNRSIISAYNALISDYSPLLVVLLGIGGSIHKDVRLCDVVIANQVVFYDKRKVVSREREKRRGEGYTIASWLQVLINDFLVGYKTPVRLFAKSLLPNPDFGLHVGPIGSGEAVVAFRDAKERQWLTDYNDKTLALETEAGGIAQAFYEDELRYEQKAEGYLVVRGISDHADIEKNDAWRQPAAENAMITLIEFLKAAPRLEEWFQGPVQ